MAWRPTLLLIFFWGYYGLSPVFAASSPSNPVILNLLKDNKPVSYVSWQRDRYFSTFDSTFDTYSQNLIKSGNNIFIFINGSGKLYKAVPVNKEEFRFERIDSTTHFGYNIGALAFSFENRIYNLGGYGFWRMNGQLRVFNDKASQWDIVKLNKEIPILTGKTEGLLWYDIAGSKIYTAYYLLRNEALKTQDLDETQFVYDVMVLDLKKNEWAQLGTLNSFLKGKLQIVKPITMSPWGQIIAIGDKISLLDFKKNEILSLDSKKDFYQSISRAEWNSSFYFKDSTLFYGDNHSIDSVNIQYADFISTKEPVYITSNQVSFTKQPVWYLLVALTLTLVGIIVWILKKQEREKKAEKIFEQTLVLSNTADNLGSVFDGMETSFLELLIKNSASGKPTSIEEQNKVLGVTKKNADLQKTRRSNTITSINRKYSFVTKSETPIIQKNKTAFDKRAYEYFIDQTRLYELSIYLNKYNSATTQS